MSNTGFQIVSQILTSLYTLLSQELYIWGFTFTWWNVLVFTCVLDAVAFVVWEMVGSDV